MHARRRYFPQTLFVFFAPHLAIGCWGVGVHKALVDNLLVQFSAANRSKLKFPILIFFFIFHPKHSPQSMSPISFSPRPCAKSTFCLNDARECCCNFWNHSLLDLGIIGGLFLTTPRVAWAFFQCICCCLHKL